MSFNYEDKETNRLQGAADNIDSMVEITCMDLPRSFWVRTIFPHTMPLEVQRGWNPRVHGVHGTSDGRGPLPGTLS